MSDYSEYAETPIVPQETWCPECSGPPISERASVQYCHDHMPVTQGSYDASTNFPTISAWMADAGGLGNANMCNLIHRKESATNV